MQNGQSWFVVSHADQSLPLVLVEHGYDVWVANSRGTTYSLRHVSSNNLSLPAVRCFSYFIKYNRHTHFHKKNQKYYVTGFYFVLLQNYWDFTYYDMAIYDLPAFLNFVYYETGQKIHYMGHSQVQITTTVIIVYSV